MITVDTWCHEWEVDGDVPVIVAIDTIGGVGTYVEFEFRDDADATDETIEQLDRFVATLDVPLGERIHRGYPHMLLCRDR